ncbi:MAG: hypothetical protein JNM75_10645 [Rhodospirillales bacterium]|nr:hypothetical protein [Rhodospirillales bacterium]
MKRPRKYRRALAVLALCVAAAAHGRAALAQPATPGPDAAAAWEAMATTDLAGLAGGSRGFDLGIVVDDVQLNASNTSTTVAGNTISGIASGDAVGNLMSEIHGFGNTMVVNTGVLTMSNSVNVNVSVDMAR